jgi:hypothetical protein
MRNCYHFVIPLRPELLPGPTILNLGGEVLHLHRFVCGEHLRDNEAKVGQVPTFATRAIGFYQTRRPK